MRGTALQKLLATPAYPASKMGDLLTTSVKGFMAWAVGVAPSRRVKEHFPLFGIAVSHVIYNVALAYIIYGLTTPIANQ